MTDEQQCALIAGGAGFLGSHLADRLIERGLSVVCLDDFSTGSRRNIAHLIGNPHFRLIETDVCEELPRLEVDQVWNLACPASPPKYQIDPIKTLMTSVLGTRNLMELSRQNNALFFQASTSEVYGDPKVHPQPEDYVGAVKTTGPRACYDEGKRAAETLCIDYHRSRGVDIRIARIFNTYGPRMDPSDGRVVSNFITAALAGKPLEIQGTGQQTRSFCYVDDLIEGFIRLMDGDEFIGPVNLGNPCELTINDLASLVIKQFNSESAIVYVEGLQDDPQQRRPDIRLAEQKLGWTPKVAFEQGLELTASYYRDHFQEFATAHDHQVSKIFA